MPVVSGWHASEWEGVGLRIQGSYWLKYQASSPACDRGAQRPGSLRPGQPAACRDRPRPAQAAPLHMQATRRASPDGPLCPVSDAVTVTIQTEGKREPSGEHPGVADLAGFHCAQLRTGQAPRDPAGACPAALLPLAGSQKRARLLGDSEVTRTGRTENRPTVKEIPGRETPMIQKEKGNSGGAVCPDGDKRQPHTHQRESRPDAPLLAFPDAFKEESEQENERKGNRKADVNLKELCPSPQSTV